MKQHLFIISYDQLDVLGFDKSYRMLVIMFIALIFIYFILKLIITLLVRKRFIIFLTYFMLSILILLFSLFSTYVNENETIIIISLQVLTIFGFALIIYQIYEKIKRFVK